MILLRKLYCHSCCKIFLHIIYCQKVSIVTYGLTAICLSMECVGVRYLRIGKNAFTELCSRTKDDEPASRGGI